MTIGGDFEAKGGVNYALHIPVLIESASARFRIACSIRGCYIGVQVDNSSLGHLCPDIEPAAGQPLSKAISLVNGSSRIRIGNATIDGEATTTYGIYIDSTCGYNVVEPCNINPGSVTTPIYINGSAVTTTKSGSSWIDTVINHNRVLPGTLDDGI